MIEEEDFDFDQNLCKDCREPLSELNNWNLDYKDDAD